MVVRRYLSQLSWVWHGRVQLEDSGLFCADFYFDEVKLSMQIRQFRIMELPVWSFASTFLLSCTSCDSCKSYNSTPKPGRCLDADAELIHELISNAELASNILRSFETSWRSRNYPSQGHPLALTRLWKNQPAKSAEGELETIAQLCLAWEGKSVSARSTVVECGTSIPASYPDRLQIEDVLQGGAPAMFLN